MLFSTSAPPTAAKVSDPTTIFDFVLRTLRSLAKRCQAKCFISPPRGAAVSSARPRDARHPPLLSQHRCWCTGDPDQSLAGPLRVHVRPEAMSRAAAARARVTGSSVPKDRCMCIAEAMRCFEGPTNVHGSGKAMLRIVDAPARPGRNIAALLRWSCIAEAGHCRAVSMDLHSRDETLPCSLDGPASSKRSVAAPRRWTCTAVARHRNGPT